MKRRLAIIVPTAESAQAIDGMIRRDGNGAAPNKGLATLAGA